MLEERVYSDLIAVQTKHHVKTTSILVNKLLKNAFKYKNEIDQLQNSIENLNKVIQKQYDDIQQYRQQRDNYYQELKIQKEGENKNGGNGNGNNS